MIVHVLNNLKYETKVSVTCVYNFINRRIELKKCAGRRYKRYWSTKTLIPERVGIEKRPKIINDRYMVGDLEIDTQRDEVKRV